MTDIVERLRRLVDYEGRPKVADEAADEIEQLWAENEQLKDRIDKHHRMFEPMRAEIERLTFELKAAQEEIKIADGEIEPEMEKPMLVIDSGTDLFGAPWYRPRLLVTEMRPVRIARTMGTFRTRQEAEAVGEAALHAVKPQARKED